MKWMLMLALVGSPALAEPPQDQAAQTARHNTELGEAPASQGDRPGFDTPPKRLSGKAPLFPVSHLMNGTKGKVVVSFTVGVDGKASEFKIIESTDPKFSDHVVIALREWRFRPAKKDGVDVPARIRQSFSFGF
jgi:protein TonB